MKNCALLLFVLCLSISCSKSKTTPLPSSGNEGSPQGNNDPVGNANGSSDGEKGSGSESSEKEDQSESDPNKAEEEIVTEIGYGQLSEELSNSMWMPKISDQVDDGKYVYNDYGLIAKYDYDLEIQELNPENEEQVKCYDKANFYLTERIERYYGSYDNLQNIEFELVLSDIESEVGKDLNSRKSGCPYITNNWAVLKENKNSLIWDRGYNTLSQLISKRYKTHFDIVKIEELLRPYAETKINNIFKKVKGDNISYEIFATESVILPKSGSIVKCKYTLSGGMPYFYLLKEAKCVSHDYSDSYNTKKIFNIKTSISNNKN